MSNFEIYEPIDNRAMGEYLIATSKLTPSLVKPSTRYGLSDAIKPSTMDYVFHMLGKPEEWATKAIGGIFSNNPKYRFGVSRPGDQANFADLFGDTFEAAFDDRLPILSTVLGLGAAIANPLDPLNKIKINALTKKGVAAERLAQIASRRPQMLKKVDDVTTLDIADIEQSLEQARNTLKTGTAAEKKAVKPVVKMLERSKSDMTSLNEYLIKAQKDGMSIDALKLAPTRFEQVQQGQRKVIGLTNPLKFDQLSMFGVGRGIFDSAAGSVTTGGLQGATKIGSDIEAAFVRMVSPIGKLGSYIAEKGADVIKSTLGYNFVGAKYRPLAKQLDSIIQDVDLEVGERLDRLKELYIKLKDQGFEQKDLEKLNQYVMDFYDRKTDKMSPGDAALLRGILKELPRKSTLGQDVIRKNADDLKDLADDVDPETGKHFVANTIITRPELEELDVNSMSPLGKVGRYNVSQNGKFIVLDQADTADTHTIEKMRDVIGAAAFETLNDTFLVARRLPGYKPILDPIMEGPPSPRVGLVFDPVHYHNLEVLGAQLAAKKLALTNISAKDLLISDSGQVMLINPDVVVPAKGTKEAATITNAQLALFGSRFQVGHTLDLSGMLSNDRVVKKIAKRAKEYIKVRRTWAHDAAQLEGDVYAISGHTLMREANNTFLHQALIEDNIGEDLAAELGDNPELARYLFETANDITAQREAIRKALQDGNDIPLDPIEISVDDLGNIQINRGRSSLTAALLEGLDTVPVKVNKTTTEWLDSAQPFTTSFVKLDAVFYNEPKTLAASKLSGTQGMVIDKNYKLLEGNKYVNIKKIHDPRKEGSIKQSVATVFGITAKGQPSNLKVNALTKTLDNIEDMQLAETIINSKDMTDLAEQLDQLLNVKLTVPFDPDTHKILQNSAYEYLELMAKEGVFSPKMFEAGFDALYQKGTLVRFADGTLIIRNSSIDDLTETAQGILNEVVKASDIVPFDRVKLISATGETNTNVFKLVGNDHPALKNSLRYKKDLRIPDVEKKRLADMGIHIDPTAEKLNLTDGRPIKFEQAETAKTNTPTFSRQTHSFYISDTGRVFIDTRQTKSYNVTNLLSDIFGEGRIPRGEVGFVTDQEIVIQYPAIDIAVLNTKTISKLRARIEQIATALGKAGYNPSLKVTLLTPIDAHVWDEMIQKDLTLGDILAGSPASKREGWLRLPKDFDNIIVDVAPASPLVYRMRRTSKEFKPGSAMHDIAKRLTAELDNARRLELEEGIPTMFRAFYIPRVATPDAERAISLLKEKTYLKLRENKRAISIVQGFMKDRTLVDLSIPEINEFVKRLREAKLLKDTQTEASILHEIAKKASEDNVPAFVWMAELFNEAGIDINAGWFYSDPILATARRVQEGGEALRRRRVVDTLAESGAVLVMTKAEIDTLRSVRNGKQPSLVALEKLKGKASELSQKLDIAKRNGLVSASDIMKMEEALNAVKLKMNEEMVKIDAINKEIQSVKDNPLAFDVDLDAPMIYIESEEARRLVNAKILDFDDISTSLDNGLVAVPAAKITTDLPNDAKIYMFPQEVMGVVERYFGAANATRGRAKEVVNFIDALTNVWRSWTLFAIPAYHIRNFVSNGFLLYLGDLANIDSLKDAGNVLNFVRLKANNKMSLEDVYAAMKANKLVNSLGEETNVYDLWAAAVKQGVFAGGQYYNEFHYAAKGAKHLGSFEAALQKMGFLPSSDMVGNILQDNALLRFGKKSSTTVENWFRLGAFIESWKKGADFTQAGLDVKKIFYDYRDLSMFERNFLRRVMPFYSWSRFNLPRMIETMFTHPIAHYRISELFNSYERQVVGGPTDKKDLPQWIQDRFGIFVMDNGDGTYMMRMLDTLIPAYEAYQFFSKNPLKAVYEKTLDLTTPLLKYPIEQISNTSLYSGELIEDLPGQPAKGFTYKQLGFSRRATISGPLGPLNLILNEALFKSATRPIDAVASIVDAVADDTLYPQARPSWWAGIFDFALGRAYRYDPEATRNIMYKDWKSTERRLVGLYKYSLQHNDSVSADFFSNELNKLRLTMPPGVNK